MFLSRLFFELRRKNEISEKESWLPWQRPLKIRKPPCSDRSSTATAEPNGENRGKIRPMEVVEVKGLTEVVKKERKKEDTEAVLSVVTVSLVQLHGSAGTDETRVRRVCNLVSDTAAQHAHRHDCEHLSADHSQGRERMDQTGACTRHSIGSLNRGHSDGRANGCTDHTIERRRHQTPPPVRCCPLLSQFEYTPIRAATWRVTLSIHLFPVAYSWQICANMTSPAKPEVGLHNVSQRRQKKTVPR